MAFRQIKSLDKYLLSDVSVKYRMEILPLICLNGWADSSAVLRTQTAFHRQQLTVLAGC